MRAPRARLVGVSLIAVAVMTGQQATNLVAYAAAPPVFTTGFST